MRGKRRICKGENFRTFVFSQLKVDKLSSLEGISQVFFNNESHFRIRRLYSLDNANNCTIPLFLKDIRNPEHARCTKKTACSCNSAVSISFPNLHMQSPLR